MHMLATGQRVVITAGAAGIGRAIAETLAAAGAIVRVCDINPQAIADMACVPPRIGATLADVRDEAAVTAFVDDTAAELGGLDVLINNAGISGPTLPIEDIGFDAWKSMLEVNLSGVFLATKAAVPQLKRAGGGAIINMSSVSGRLGVPLRSPYAATKWGIVGMTQSLAKELGPFGIRVNAILPGFVEGPRMDRVIAARATRTGTPPEKMREIYLEKVSTRRMVPVADIAAQALFLVSPAGRSVSGQSLGVCGNVEYL